MASWVSLGPTCSVAYQLQKMGLRKEALPFDWIRMRSVKDVITLLNTRFENFLDVTFIKNATTFPLIKDSDTFDEAAKAAKKACVTTAIYKNKKLKIDFFHDFAEGTSIEEVRDKYSRRIDRFFEKIKGKCVFVRDDKYFKQHNIADYNVLNDILIKHNPESALVLVVDTSKGEFDFSALNSNIKVFKDPKKHWKWQHDSICGYIKSFQNECLQEDQTEAPAADAHTAEAPAAEAPAAEAHAADAPAAEAPAAPSADP
jgi:hypothetical protein